MIFSESDMDEMVYEILEDCEAVQPPLERNEITQHVLGQLSMEIHKHVCASLERLIQRGRIANDRTGAAGQPIRYHLSRPTGARN